MCALPNAKLPCVLSLYPRILPVSVLVLGLAACRDGSSPSEPEPVSSLDAGASDAATDAVAQDQVIPGFDAPPSEIDGAPDTSPAPDASDAPLDIPSKLDRWSGADAPPDTTPEAPYPPVCGDGYRDPGTEECDDGLDSSVDPNARACTSSCEVSDQAISLDPTGRERRLGLGRHPVASGPEGSAGAFVEQLTLAEGGDVRVGVALFSPVGERMQVATLPGALYNADPVVAALPDGSFALAFNSLDVDGDGLGVALTRVMSDGSVGSVTPANHTTLFGQHSPDIIWTGTELVVGWEDESVAAERRVCTRRFSQTLTPIDGQDQCMSGNGWFRSHLVLAELGDGPVKAWREELAGEAKAVVGMLGWTAELPLGGLAAWWEAPALAAIDSDHVLLVHASAQDELLGLVADTQGAVVWGPAPLFLPPAAPRYSPALAVTAGGIYLAWQEPPPPPDPTWDPHYEETWIQRIGWDGVALDAETAFPIALPRYPWHRPGDRTLPALAATPLIPQGAIFAAWNDLTATNYPGEAPHGDVAFSLVPTPILRQPLGQ